MNNAQLIGVIGPDGLDKSNLITEIANQLAAKHIPYQIIYCPVFDNHNDLDMASTQAELMIFASSVKDAGRTVVVGLWQAEDMLDMSIEVGAEASEPVLPILSAEASTNALKLLESGLSKEDLSNITPIDRAQDYKSTQIDNLMYELPVGIGGEPRFDIISSEPINELDLIIDDVFLRSGLGYVTTAQSVKDCPINLKQDCLVDLYRSSQVGPTFIIELFQSYKLIQELACHSDSSAIIQLVSPSNGYDISELNYDEEILLLIEAEYDNSFVKYSELQQKGQGTAQEACLPLHRTHAVLNLNLTVSCYNNLKIVFPELAEKILEMCKLEYPILYNVLQSPD